MSKLKFIMASTGEEVKIGDTINKVVRAKSSFGTMETLTSIVLTDSSIRNLIINGIIKVIPNSEKEETPEKYDYKNVGFYIDGLAVKFKRNFSEVVKMLEDINKVCPKAVFDILLQEIATFLRKKDIVAFYKAETMYGLKPKDGTVGKVTNFNPFIPLFKSAEDAELARAILKEQLELMYGK